MRQILNSYRSLLIATSENTRRLSRQTRILRLIIAVVGIAALTVLCGFTTNVRVVLAIWSWMLLGIVPLVVGTYLIFIKLAVDHPTIGTILLAGLLGLITFALTVSSLLYDEKMIRAGWSFTFVTGLEAGAFMFFGGSLILLGLSWLRSLNK